VKRFLVGTIKRGDEFLRRAGNGGGVQARTAAGGLHGERVSGAAVRLLIKPKKGRQGVCA